MSFMLKSFEKRSHLIKLQEKTGGGSGRGLNGGR